MSASTNRAGRKVIGAVGLAVVLASSLALTACGEGGIGAASSPQPDKLETHGAEAIDDADGSGVEVSRRLFDAADTAVVSGPKREDQLKAAALAVDKGAPMLVRYPATDDAVSAELERLGADEVIEVGAGAQDTADDATEPVQSLSLIHI